MERSNQIKSKTGCSWYLTIEIMRHTLVPYQLEPMHTLRPFSIQPDGQSPNKVEEDTDERSSKNNIQDNVVVLDVWIPWHHSTDAIGEDRDNDQHGKNNAVILVKVLVVFFVRFR